MTATAIKSADDSRPIVRMRSDYRNATALSLDLGWQMATAYRRARSSALIYSHSHPDGSPQVLNSVKDIGAPVRLRQELKAVEVTIQQISQCLSVSEMRPPSLDEVWRRLDTLEPRDTIAAEGVRRALNEFHVSLLGWLTAIDQSEDLAYRLGRALSDGCRESVQSISHLFCSGSRFEVESWLTQLGSALPPYSTDAVLRSFRRWVAELQSIVSNHRATTEGSQSNSSDDREFQKWADNNRKLACRYATAARSQGFIWRWLLTGRLNPQDLLAEDDYACIVDKMVERNRHFLAAVTRRLFWPVIFPLIVAMLAGLAVAAIAASGSPIVRVAAGLITLAGGFFAGWRVISKAALTAMGTVNKPIYDSELTERVHERASAPLFDLSQSVPAGDQVASRWLSHLIPVGRTRIAKP